MRFRTASIKFRVQPFKYEKDGEETTENVSEGNVIELENAKIPSFKLYGITKQDGTPTPDAPIEIEVATGSVNVKSTGKNLWNILKEKTDTIVTTSDNTNYTFTTKGTTRVYEINGKPNTRYTCNVTITTGDNGGDLYVYFEYSDGTNSSVGYINQKSATTETFTKTSNNEKTLVGISVRTYNLGSYPTYIFNKPILVEGTIEQEYEPYKESSITYNLGDNFLADKDYIQDGVLNKNIGKVVLNGSESWHMGAETYNGLHYFTTKSITDFKQGIAGRPVSSFTSDHFHYVNGGSNGDLGGAYFLNELFVVFMGFDNVTDFKNWLSENPVTVYYELEIPEQIQLEATGELKEFEPNTIITNDLDSNMVVYFLDMPIAENKGNYFAKPIITIEGTGTIEFIVNGNKLFRYTFPEGENKIVIDSEKQDAYLEGVLKNRNMSGEFPVFEIGKNIISWEGVITRIQIASKSRWL